MELDNGFREKINRFIKFSRHTNENGDIKLAYIKLVKEFHPDTNKEIDSETANEYMGKGG
jgi:curved DNA-binding protein CbpA